MEVFHLLKTLSYVLSLKTIFWESDFLLEKALDKKAVAV
jgi:hypothetical protein